MGRRRRRIYSRCTSRIDLARCVVNMRRDRAVPTALRAGRTAMVTCDRAALVLMFNDSTGLIA